MALFVRLNGSRGSSALQNKQQRRRRCEGNLGVLQQSLRERNEECDVTFLLLNITTEIRAETEASLEFSSGRRKLGGARRGKNGKVDEMCRFLTEWI